MVTAQLTPPGPTSSNPPSCASTSNAMSLTNGSSISGPRRVIHRFKRPRREPPLNTGEGEGRPSTPLWRKAQSRFAIGRRGIFSGTLVGTEGLEPSRPRGQRILSPLRLPVPPRPRTSHHRAAGARGHVGVGSTLITRPVPKAPMASARASTVAATSASSRPRTTRLEPNPSGPKNG